MKQLIFIERVVHICNNVVVQYARLAESQATQVPFSIMILFFQNFYKVK